MPRMPKKKAPRAPRTATQARKQRAPVRLTGGSGARQENEIAAGFLLDMLSSSNRLGSEFGRVVRVDWQATDMGWLMDDLAVMCKPAGSENRFVRQGDSADKVVMGKLSKSLVKIVAAARGWTEAFSYFGLLGFVIKRQEF